MAPVSYTHLFVRELSDKWELPCFEVFEDVPAYAKKWGMSEEEAGRACRYEQFEKLRREKNADCIAAVSYTHLKRRYQPIDKTADEHSCF